MSDSLIKYLGLALGWGLVALGAVVFLRAVFADRARGRRRCPRCWYLMTGVPGLKCPECGRTAKKEKRLFRTRRRWRRALAGGAAALVGFVAMCAADLIRLGWLKGTPTPALLLLVPVDSSEWEGTDISKRWAVFVLASGVPPRGAPSLPPVGAATPKPPARSGAASWRDEIADELLRRVTDNELRRWHGDFLAARIQRVRQSRGETVIWYNCSDLLRQDWIPASTGPVVTPLPDLAGLLGNLPEHIDGAMPRIVVSGVPPLPSKVHAARTSRAATFDELADHANVLGPLLFLRDTPHGNDLERLLTALRAATPTKPAALDEPQWQTRRALIERLRATQVTVRSTDATIQDAFDAVTDATGLPVRPNWDALYQAGIGQDDPTAPGQLRGTAGDILDWTLHWIRHRENVILRWTVTDDAVVFTSPDTVIFDLPGMPHSLVRVYDVRDIICAGLRAFPDSTLADQESTLLSALDTAAFSNDWYRVNRLLFNGRLIIRAQPAVHMDIEECLQQLHTPSDRPESQP